MSVSVAVASMVSAARATCTCSNTGLNGRGAASGGRSRQRHAGLGRKAQLFVAAAVAAAVLRCCAPSFLAPAEQQRRSMLRQLLPASASVLLLGSPGVAEGELIMKKPGDRIQVGYDGPIGDDFFIGGGQATMGTLQMTNPKVLAVNPDSKAYAQGLRVGDELVLVKKDPEDPSWYSEGQLRKEKDIDGFVKKIASDTTQFDVQVGQGCLMTFIVKGVAQVGDDAPPLELPSSTGGKLSLAELLKGNKHLVLWFAPGGQYQSMGRSGGFVAEMKAWAKVQGALAQTGTVVAGVTAEQPKTLKSQSDFYKIDYPMLSDYYGETAQRWGPFKRLDGAPSDAIVRGSTLDRMTFIIGADGIVEASFVAVGFDADKDKIADHVADVVRVLGGDEAQAKKALKPKQQSLGDMLEVMTGKQAPPA
eukprot:TRINITY_DN28148_c0_g1_i1.p1 TRINITY_DN28148_c0_g1~~TRINITY_DN28148_c0_g1_i1.p1  ORF type:complete len:419 (+),score=95.99 TRINITY_DN28148_c0_g1_i1:19-1275(+)